MIIRWFLPTSPSGQLALARQQHQLKLRLVDDHLVVFANVDGDDKVDDEEQMTLA